MPEPREVLIIHRRLAHYRLPLFQRLRDTLAERRIHLRVLAGEGTERERSRRDGGELPWAEKLPTHYWLGDRICWQPSFRYLRGADLVIVTQESSQIASQLLALLPRRRKVAFWGHGANLQSENPKGLRERYKSWVSRRVDWWFAYTSLSSEIVEGLGFPPSRITVLNNAVELPSLGISTAPTQAVGTVGVYLGSFSGSKRLEALCPILDAIRERVPDFQFVFVGDGPERDVVQSFCSSRTWCRWIGPRFGSEKREVLEQARLMVHPYALGLGILDSFATGVPLVTMDCGTHGPEIAYLQSGENGVITPDSPADFVEACVELLTNDARWALLREGALLSSQEFTLEKMVTRFANGIEDALAADVGSAGLAGVLHTP